MKIIQIFGYPGAGKTYLAKHINEMDNIRVLDTDDYFDPDQWPDEIYNDLAKNIPKEIEKIINTDDIKTIIIIGTGEI